MVFPFNFVVFLGTKSTHIHTHLRSKNTIFSYKGTEEEPEEPIDMWIKEKSFFYQAGCHHSETSPHITWTKLEGEHLAEKNLLIAFYERGKCEETMVYHLKYPWPFSGWGSNGKEEGGKTLIC